MSKLLLAILISILFITCKNRVKTVPVEVSSHLQHVEAPLNKDSVKAIDYVFFSDSVFHGQKEILKYYLTRYGSDSCYSLRYKKEDVIKEFRGLHELGKIHDRTTSVFVLNPLNYCGFDNEKYVDGQAYYFTDTTLPRLQTESYCCDPSNVFLVGDIDEDGVSEIGLYLSSCVSHYKALIVYSLKNNKWHQIGSCVYDLNYMDSGKPYSYFVRKTAKGKFEMLAITDLTSDKTKIGKENLIRFSM